MLGCSDLYPNGTEDFFSLLRKALVYLNETVEEIPQDLPVQFIYTLMKRFVVRTGTSGCSNLVYTYPELDKLTRGLEVNVLIEIELGIYPNFIPRCLVSVKRFKLCHCLSYRFYIDREPLP